MNRSLVSALSLTAAVLAAVPATAGPAPADVGRFAVTRAVIASSDGRTLELLIRGEALTGGPRLTIDAQRCDEDACSPARTYATELPGDALTVDSSAPHADLRTTLGGRTLAIRWRAGDKKSLLIGGLYAGGEGGSTVAGEYAGDGAAVEIDYAGERCGTDGVVGNGVEAETTDPIDGTARPHVDALRIPAQGALRC